ncbi:hypothetical protein [Nostoc sp. LPT]|uniref:hypothetical protein n=1 Tax=Nostoc sp. LPT TaxID=2815387 RepID=UPI001E0D700E|nr:hypothetical protein [Nostoc sp. LPT]MBN4006117.1 hypothetical protein [Nostoc sp. LPT]
MTSSCNSSDNLAIAGNPEFDTQLKKQKFIFISGLKKNSGLRIKIVGNSNPPPRNTIKENIFSGVLNPFIYYASRIQIYSDF